MEAFPLGIQEGVQHLPPGSTVQHEGQAHNGRDGYEDSVHCQMLRVHPEDGQKGDPSNNAAEDEQEDDERRETARFLPSLLTCGTTDGLTITDPPAPGTPEHCGDSA